MAITESLPVGNEAVTVAASKMGSVADAGAFAKTFAAAGKAAEPTPSSKGSGSAASAKVRQDLAGWAAGRGLETHDGSAGGERVKEPGDEKGAVSSSIGKQEIVEDAGAGGSQILDQAVSGTGERETGWTGAAAGQAGANEASGLSAGEATALLAGAELEGKTGFGIKTLSSGYPAAGVEVAPSGPLGNKGGIETIRTAGKGGDGLRAQPVAILGPDRAPDGFTAAAAAMSRGQGLDAITKKQVGGSQAGSLEQMDNAAPTTGTTGAKDGLVAFTDGQFSRADGTATPEKLDSRTTQSNVTVEVEDKVAPGQTVARAGTERIGGRERMGTAAASEATVNGRGGEKTGVGSVSRKDKSAEAKGRVLAANGSGSPPVAGAVAAQGFGATSGSLAAAAVTPVFTAAPMSSASHPAPAAVQVGGSTVQTPVEAATAEGGQVAGQSVSALAHGPVGADGVASAVAHRGAIAPGHGRAGALGLGTAQTGKRETGLTRKATEESAAPVVVAARGGDGSNVLAVTAGTTEAPVAVASVASAVAMGGVLVAGVSGVAVPAGIKPQSGTSAAVKDKVGKTNVEGSRRSDASAHDAGKVSEEVQTGNVVPSGGAVAASAGKAGAEQTKIQDTTPAVSAAPGVNANGAVSPNAHGSAAAGWSGPVATASSTAVPVRAEVLSGTAGASARSAGAAEDGGLGTGLSSGLVGSGQGHTTLQATPTVLEVGIPGGSHGWLKVRAEMGEGGAVQASVSSATQAGQEALRRELPAMSAYLQSEHVPVTLQMAHGMANAASASTASGLTGGEGSAGSGFGSGGGQTGANAEQGRSDSTGFAGFSLGGSDAGETGSRQQGSDAGGVASAVSGTGAADEVSAAVASAERDWSPASGYGGVSSGGGGSWVNVIA